MIISIPDRLDGIEAVRLCQSLGLPCIVWDEDSLYACDFNPKIPARKITLPELRELAKPREYLNDKHELVVTNQPLDGWLLVKPEYQLFVTDKLGIGYFTTIRTLHNDQKILWQRKKGNNDEH